ncbi:MAG: methyltransferase domain-containing protein [Alcanivoracaceae bacterium]|nr:methyltransferase domain-containing protein [Alcanivoracaceae bacterium]
MHANSSPVISSQTGCHRQLEGTVLRHLSSPWQKPVSRHGEQAFEAAARWLERQGCDGVILDSGCGTGRSSLALAERHPDQAVIGLDQSAQRIGVLPRSRQSLPANLLLVRAECADFWRLAESAAWPLSRHYLLYPNPWPKPGHLKRRWHGHPVFPVLMRLPGRLVLRSNWHEYVEEFAHAARLAGRQGGTMAPYVPVDPLSDFERKYHESGHELHQFCLPAEMSTG